MEKSGLAGLSQTPILLPEWLSKEPHYSRENSNQGSISNGIGGPSYPLSSSPQSPRVLARSKSHPLLIENEVPPKEKSDVFTMLQERNSFDRNFPVLNPVAKKPVKIEKNVTTTNPSVSNSTPPPTTPNGTTSNSSVWKQAPISDWKSKPANTNITNNGNLSSVSSMKGSNLRMSNENVNTLDGTDKGLVVVPVPIPMPTSTKTLNGRTRDTAHSTIKKKDSIPKKPARPFDMSLMRKATSDPSLPLAPEYADKFAKIVSVRRNIEKPKDKIVVEGVPASSSADRKDKVDDKAGSASSSSPLRDSSEKSKVGIPLRDSAEKPKSSGLKDSSDRNDFFHDLFIKEEQLKKMDNKVDASAETTHSVGSIASAIPSQDVPVVVPNSVEFSVTSPTIIPPSIMNESNPISTRSSQIQDKQVAAPKSPAHKQQQQSLLKEKSIPKRNNSFSVEDEERFLRYLGWLPEEEENIPELTQEEITTIKTYLNNNGTNQKFKQKSKLSLDNSIKKWQQEKYTRPIQTVL